MNRSVTPFRIAVGLGVAVLATFVILLKIPSGDYLLLPDIAHPVAPLVRVADGKPAKDGGELYFVDVQEEQASEFDIFLRWLGFHQHSTLIPANLLIPPGSNSQQLIHAELQQMAMSQKIAAAVALRHLGYHVDIHPNGVLVNQILLGTDAARTLQPTDVIVAVNGQPTLTEEALRTLMAKVKPRQVVTLRVVGGGNVTRTVQVNTVAGKDGRALIGIAPAQSVVIGKLPLKVSIDAGGIGGPSAGLAFTLEVMRQLGHDVTHGYKVAATGEININGTVSPIGGVEQKTYGAREAGAQVFLVPAGPNAKTAEKFAGPDLRIIPVTSFAQALHALAALPKLK